MSGSCAGASAGAAGWVEDARAGLAVVDPAGLDDAGRLDLLRSLEDLTRSAAALAARAQVAFADSQVAEQAAAGVPVRRRGLAVADDLAAARKTSPYWGSRELTGSRALVTEMPRTLAALEVGTISAYQARIITEATTCLDPGDRAEVDQRLSAALEGASSAEIGKAVRALVYEIDPAGFVARARKAAKDRGVSSRPAPDVMAVLSARLPAPAAVACHQALHEHATTARASGDPRTLNQLMADTLVERLTGRSVVDGIDIEVGLLITDSALFDGTSDAADLAGYGPIPAQMARDLLADQTGADDRGPAGGDDDGPSAAEDQEASGTKGTSAAGAEGDEPAPDVCPDGSRCASWDCTSFHGTPPTTAPAPTEPAPTEPAPTAPPASAPTADSSERTEVGDGDPGARAAKVWLRRLYADPVTGVLTTRDPRRRDFTGSLRAFLVARDRTCRNSWCGAPIRDIDHVRRRRHDGPATEDNGRGLCRRCNLARERERFRDPPPESYRPPPPALHTLTGRPPPGGESDARDAA